MKSSIRPAIHRSIVSSPRAHIDQCIERLNDEKTKTYTNRETHTDNQRSFNGFKMPDSKIKIKLSASILIAHAPVQITYYVGIVF